MNNVDNIISELKKTRKPFKVTVTGGVEVEVLPLSLAQQKVMLDSAFQGVTGIYKFNNTLNKIITENVQPSSGLTTIDRIIIALNLRSRLKNEVETEDGSFLLKQHIEQLHNNVPALPEETIQSEDVTFTVRPPTVDIDTKFNQFVLTAYKDEANAKVDLSTFAGDVYLHELAKFIKIIKINSSGTSFNLHEEPWKAVKILDAVSSVDLTSVTAYVKRVRDIEASLLPTINGNRIDILPSLFVV